MSSNALKIIDNINIKINKIFQNSNINFFIIMNLILIISCYTFVNSAIKTTISSLLSNPIIILFSLIFIIFVGYHNINIAILMLLLLFVVIYGSTIFKQTNKIEGFTSTKEDDDDDENDDDDEEDTDDSEDFSDTIKEKSKDSFKKKIKEDEENDRNDKINSIKSILFNSVNNLKSTAENEYKKSVAENLQLVYENEKKQNKNISKNSGKSSSKNSGKSSGKSKNNRNNKEDFKAINVRKFDPSNEEDTNLLITKEILQDIINRIEYNFESNTYLKKYIKHRLEEVVEINKLLDDEED